MANPSTPQQVERLRLAYVAHEKAWRTAEIAHRANGLEGDALKRAVNADPIVVAAARVVKEAGG